MKSKVKAILFDYDDTLVKTKESVWGAHKIAAKKFYDLDLTEEIMAVHWGKPYPTMLVDMYNHLDPYEKLHQNYMSVRRDYPMKIYEESIGVVNQLLPLYQIGIVTAATAELIMVDLELLHFPYHELTFIQTADDTPVHKPDPKVFEPALKKLKDKTIKPEEVLYVGDDLRDYYAATGAGIQFVGIARKADNPFKEVKANIIKNLTELLNLI
jgi:phosphoglycolate phosphatase